MPHVELIDLKQEQKVPAGDSSSRRNASNTCSAQPSPQAGHQAILLLNRRGKFHFTRLPQTRARGDLNAVLHNDDDGYRRRRSVDARNATLAAGLHTGQLHCHYCLAVNPLPPKCPACGKLLSLFGLGTQRVEEEPAPQFPDLKFARVDSDSMRQQP